MSTDPAVEGAVRRELLRLALQNSGRSVPLQIVAVAFLVYLGVDENCQVAAAATAALGLAVAFWRLDISRRYRDSISLSDDALLRAQHELEGNAGLAGLMWVVSTIGIYPALHGTMATAYVAMVFGSITVAAFFMTLIGRSFLILASLQLGALVVASIVIPAVASAPVVVLAIVFGLTAVQGANQLKKTTVDAIGHSHEADIANARLLQAKESADAASIAADKASLAKSQFLATMSHEIRTPMNGVLGALDLLRHSHLDANQRRLVRTAASSGETLMNILNDVLDHSKIEAGKLALNIAPMSLHSIAASVAALFRANAENKGLQLLFEVEQDVANWVLGDAQRLKQVLLNLVGNAIKFTERGNVTLRLTPLLAPDGWARVAFEVQDTGIGLSAEAQKRLFEPFHQETGSRKRGQSGTGLGLAISQRIVEAMGGYIQVRSQVGVGSTFFFALSLELDTSPVPPVLTDSAMGGLDEPSGLSGTVLLVEDNPVNLLIALEMLQSFGLDVIEADDGAQVLDLLARHPIDLVLMDCNMQDMDGYQATRLIRQREAEQGLTRLPIVALTANAFEEDIRRTQEAGMDDHLSKPYTRVELRAKLTRWL